MGKGGAPWCGPVLRFPAVGGAAGNFFFRVAGRRRYGCFRKNVRRMQFVHCERYKSSVKLYTFS